jgi:cysteine desulfurase/selenocysteine lyase
MERLNRRKFSVRDIRQDFPALRQQVYGKNLIYFDNGATSQKPQHVLNAINQYYSMDNANIHRGVHHLSQKATNEYEESRVFIQNYLNAEKKEEIIFTSGTTDGINLVANSYCQLLSKGDEIIITQMEHHSNIVPWQMACERFGLVLRVVPINKRGELDMAAFEGILNERSKLVAVTHISNTLGTINPVKEIIEKAHAVGSVLRAFSILRSMFATWIVISSFSPDTRFSVRQVVGSFTEKSICWMKCLHTRAAEI